MNAIAKNVLEFFSFFLGDRVLDNALDKTGILPREGSAGSGNNNPLTKGLTAKIGGIGTNDEFLTLLAVWKAVEKVDAHQISIADIQMVARAMKRMSIAKRKKMLLIFGKRESAIKTGEHWLDGKGNAIDESAPPAPDGKGKPRGPQKVTKVITKEMANEDGAHILLALVKIGKANPKDPETAIVEFLEDMGIVRSVSDEVKETLIEIDKSVDSAFKAIGVDPDEIAEKAMDFRQKAELKLAQKRAAREARRQTGHRPIANGENNGKNVNFYGRSL